MQIIVHLIILYLFSCFTQTLDLSQLSFQCFFSFRMVVIRISRANSLGDIIVWMELPGQKYQKCVCQHTDVVQTGQVGWMMLILQWKMVKLKGRSALVIVLTVANMPSEFQSKIVYPTSSTNFTHLLVTHATVVQIECEAKNLRNKGTHKMILRYTYFRDFAKSSIDFLLQRLYADDVLLTCNQKCFEFHIIQSISFVIIITNNQSLLKEVIKNKKERSRKGKYLNSEILDKQEYQSV